MVDFSISELRILQSYKNSWKAGRHKQSKHHVYQQVVQAAHKLPETQGMSKQAWTERKKVGLQIERKHYLMTTTGLPPLVEKLWTNTKAKGADQVWQKLDS